jgi:Skp family chaperone for outer membrane proteins
MIPTLTRVLMAVLIGFCLVNSVGAASAQQFPAAVIAVVQVQTIMSEAKAAQSIQQQIEQRRSEYQAEISAEEIRLRDLEQELARQRSVLSPEAYAGKRREFEEQVAAVQRKVQDRRRALDRAYSDGVRRIQEELTAVIGEIAQEQGITLVLPVSQTLFAETALRITPEALKRLDERLPAVKLEFPAS